jgi:L-asparaginase II
MNTQPIEPFGAFGTHSAAAFLRSSTMAVEGIQALAGACSSFANRSIERTTMAMMALSAARTPAELQLVAAVLTKANIEALALESHRLNRLAKSIFLYSMVPLTDCAESVLTKAA